MNSNNINSKQYLVILAVVYPIEKLIYDNMKYLNYFLQS